MKTTFDNIVNYLANNYSKNVDTSKQQYYSN